MIIYTIKFEKRTVIRQMASLGNSEILELKIFYELM